MEEILLKKLVSRGISYGIVQPGIEEAATIPVVKVNNIVAGLSDVESLDKTTEDVAKKNQKTCLNGGELLVSVVGTLGKTAIVPQGFKGANINRATAMVDISDEIIKMWVKYYIDSPNGQNYLFVHTNTGVQPRINIQTLENMPIPLMEKRLIEKIVSFLEAIDNKIKTNTDINRNLSEQALALFFQYYEQASKIESFSKHIKVLGGGTPKTNEAVYWNGDIPFFTPKDVGTPYTFNTEKNITEEGLAHCNSRLYPINTTFVTARGTVGKVALAGVPMAMNQSCYALASDSINPLLVYFYTIEAVKSLKHKASGAVFDAIVTRDFDTEIINYLDEQSADEFVICVTPMIEQIRRSTIESQKLQKLRDGLLPKLMSGELDVSDLDI